MLFRSLTRSSLLFSRIRSVLSPTEHLSEDGDEGDLEVAVGHHVDEGVEGGVAVPDPEEDRDHHVRTRTTGATDGHRQVPEHGKNILVNIAF